MAMADRRPLGIPVTSAHASPSFNPEKLGAVHSMKPTISDLKGRTSENDINTSLSDAGGSPGALSPNSRSISPDSLMNSGSVAAKKDVSSNSSRGSTPPSSTHRDGASSGFYEQAGLSNSMLAKKPKPSGRVPIATGISTTIPVTGEKPKPEQDGDTSLEDDVLFAIFLILYEKDIEGAGMTVKQICDVLVERHPDMAQLSSKTSNLVSAKLNAYVKRVEKGDANLRYALSREWADASPKRMVYVYRGLLAKDFHVHIKSAMESQKGQPDASSAGAGANDASGRLSPAFSTDSFEAAKQSALQKPRRQTMYDLGITRHSFADPADLANLFVPYSSAPVAANMPKQQDAGVAEASEPASETAEASEKQDSVADAPVSAAAGKKLTSDSDFDFDDLEVFNETDEDDEMDVFHLDITRKAMKRSKSMSHFAPEKKAKFVTAAAAAPRVPRTPCSHSPMAAAAAAALHAAALKAIAASTSSNASLHDSVQGGAAGAKGGIAARSNSVGAHSNWASAVRSGFLTQEIGAPEDVSLSDLDKLFG